MSGGQAALDAGMIPHELGHHWFTEAFWPDAVPPAGAERPRHYGGPGPDWLEETAAVIMEDAPTATLRRAQFDALMRGETLPSIGGTVPRGTLLDLRLFLSRAHPAFARAMAAPPPMQPGGGIGVTFRPAGAAGSAPAGARDEALYYLQARRFADFLIETSGRADILADIARFIAAGGAMEGWLAREGAGHGLPGTIDALDAAWRGWADAQAGAAAARGGGSPG